AGFVDRLPRIADEMTLKSLDARTGAASHPALANGSPDPRRATVTLDVTFHTQRVGDVARQTALNLVLVGDKDKAAWKIDWTPEAILPHLSAGRLVRMTRLPTSRGRIVARDGTELATFVEAAVVGVVPGQIRSEPGMLASLSSVLGMKADDIRGSYGFRLGIVEADERSVETLAETPAIAGRDVVLSLDPKMQAAAEKALGDRKGAIVAEDPWSGEILALASRPSFDLNAFAGGDAGAVARYTSDPNRPLFNRATFGQYATG